MRAHLRQVIRNHRRLITFITTAIALVVITIAYTGFYPVMIVNGDWISARRFQLHLNAANHYENDQVQASTTTSVLRSNDLAISVLEGLVEEQLVEQGAKIEFGDKLESLRKERVGHFFDTPKVVDDESKKYGLSVNQFEKEILKPQVTRDLLAGRLFLKSSRIEDWLTAEKKSASVVIFSNIFFWDGQDVKTK